MRFTSIALVPALALMLTPRVWAQANLTFVPSVSLSTVYDDNLFARKDGDAGVMTRLRPAFEGIYQSPTLTLLSLY